MSGSRVLLRTNHTPSEIVGEATIGSFLLLPFALSQLQRLDSQIGSYWQTPERTMTGTPTIQVLILPGEPQTLFTITYEVGLHTDLPSQRLSTLSAFSAESLVSSNAAHNAVLRRGSLYAGTSAA